MSEPVPFERPQTRRRAWSTFGIVALVVAIYLALWVAYAANGLVDYGRYQQLSPGAAGRLNGIEYRVLSLTRTAVLNGQSAGSQKSAPPSTVWVLAVMEATRSADGATSACSVDLMGPGRRIWDTTLSAPSRELNSYCKDDVPVGTPQKFEAIFVVPEMFADEIYGIVLRNYASSTPSQILRPT